MGITFPGYLDNQYNYIHVSIGDPMFEVVGNYDTSKVSVDSVSGDVSFFEGGAWVNCGYLTVNTPMIYRRSFNVATGEESWVAIN